MGFARDIPATCSVLAALGSRRVPIISIPTVTPERARKRLAYVLSQLRESGVVSAEQPTRGLPPIPNLVAYERPRRDIGFQFVDKDAREAKTPAGIGAITANFYTVRPQAACASDRAE